MPLSGIKVIDLTRILAGPFCTQLLADLGAEVIKVEPPGRGDPVRGQGAIKDGLSWYYAQFNRNKKSLTLDLYGDAGKTVLADLIRGADVLVENYRPGVLAKMGFDAARLEQLNPALIVGSVNGYGSTGPYVDRPAFDFIAQAMSGFMSVNGAADQEPVRAGPPIADLIAGLYAAFGIVAALVARGGPGSGRGQRVEASLTGGLISMLAYFSAQYFATGQLPERTGNDHPVIYPYGLFHAADGDVAIAPSTPVHVRRLLEALGLGHLLDDPAFADNARARAQPRAPAPADQRQDRRGHRRGVDRAPECRGRAVRPGDEPRRGIRRSSGAGAGDGARDRASSSRPGAHDRLSGQAQRHACAAPQLTPPCAARPQLGEHTEEVLRALGYSAEQIASLRAGGIV